MMIWFYITRLGSSSGDNDILFPYHREEKGKEELHNKEKSVNSSNVEFCQRPVRFLLALSPSSVVHSDAAVGYYRNPNWEMGWKQIEHQ